MAATLTQPRVLVDNLPKSLVRDIALVIGGALFIAMAAQVALPLPFSPIPLTLQTFAVLATGAALGSRRGLASASLYLALAFAGLPVLAPTADGSHLTGSAILGSPTLGYVLGFAVAAALVGRIAERGFTRTPLRTAAAMVFGNFVIYAFGVPVLAAATGVDTLTALQWGLYPFLIGDLIKIVAAAGLFPAAWHLLGRTQR